MDNPILALSIQPRWNVVLPCRVCRQLKQPRLVISDLPDPPLGICQLCLPMLKSGSMTILWECSRGTYAIEYSQALELIKVLHWHPSQRDTISGSTALFLKNIDRTSAVYLEFITEKQEVLNATYDEKTQEWWPTLNWLNVT